MWTWLCLQCTQTRKIYLLLWRNCKRMFEGSWNLKVNTPYFELIQQRTVFSKWLLLSNESRIPGCLRAHRGSSNFTMSTSSIADSRSCAIAWPYLMMKLPYERLTNPLQQTFKKSFGHWKSSEFQLQVDLFLPPVFFLAKWYPSSDNTGEHVRSWKMVVCFKGVFYLKSSTKEVKLLVETSGSPKTCPEMFCWRNKGTHESMVLRRQPFLSKQVDRCKWVGNHNHKQKTLISTFGPTSFTDSHGVFCWIFYPSNFSKPSNFFEDQPTTHQTTWIHVAFHGTWPPVLPALLLPPPSRPP